jgi:DnaK suppressor protein
MTTYFNFRSNFADKTHHLSRLDHAFRIEEVVNGIKVVTTYEEDSVDKKKIDQFKVSLLKHRQQILNVGLLNKTDDLHVSEDDLSDETDLASSLIQQQITCTIRDREYLKLRRIDAALDRCAEGTYGHCEDCEEEIGMKRLENQPWSELCIQHAEEREKEESQIYRQA